MDLEGYPEYKELKTIKKWDHRKVFSLIDYIKERWTYDNYFIQKWGKNYFKKPVLFLELHTGGWSGNESIIYALLDNEFIKLFWYVKWVRGGHFYFEINPYNIGYIKVSEMAKKLSVSRQYIHKAKHKFEWITAGNRIKLVRQIRYT